MALYDNDVLTAVRALRGPPKFRVFMAPEVAKQLRDDGKSCTDDEVVARLDAMASERKIMRHGFSISWTFPASETPEFHSDADGPTYVVYRYHW